MHSIYPHAVVVDKYTRGLLPEDHAGFRGAIPCQDCVREKRHGVNAAFCKIGLVTRDLYVCSEHYDARKEVDRKNLRIDDALSQGFSAGNYANAYTSNDLQAALEVLDDEPRELNGGETREAFRAAFMIGFFSSYEDDEMSDEDREHHDEAYNAWAARMMQIGIACDREPNKHDDLVCLDRECKPCNDAGIVHTASLCKCC